MASAGAKCNHINHVSTQLPYVMAVALISGIAYMIAGWVQNPVIPMITGMVIIGMVFYMMKYINNSNNNEGTNS